MFTAEVKNRSSAPAEHGRHRAQQHPDDQPDRGRGQRQSERQSGRDQDPGQDVPAEVVGAEPMLGAGAGVDRFQVVGHRLGAPDDRGEDGQQDQDQRRRRAR